MPVLSPSPCKATTPLGRHFEKAVARPLFGEGKFSGDEHDTS